MFLDRGEGIHVQYVKKPAAGFEALGGGEVELFEEEPVGAAGNNSAADKEVGLGEPGPKTGHRESSVDDGLLDDGGDE